MTLVMCSLWKKTFILVPLAFLPYIKRLKNIDFVLIAELQP
jgi:hypothetical protein